MVEYVSSNSQFGLMMSCSGILFIVYDIVSIKYRDCDPTYSFVMGDRQFASYQPIA